jgi:hypothetical protein
VPAGLLKNVWTAVPMFMAYIPPTGEVTVYGRMSTWTPAMSSSPISGDGHVHGRLRSRDAAHSSHATTAVAPPMTSRASLIAGVPPT